MSVARKKLCHLHQNKAGLSWTVRYSIILHLAAVDFLINVWENDSFFSKVAWNHVCRIDFLWFVGMLFSPLHFSVFQVTRPLLNPGVPVVPWPVFPASVVAEPTAPARVPSVTCAVAAACSLPPRPGGAGTDASTSTRSVTPCARPSLPPESQLSSCQKVLIRKLSIYDKLDPKVSINKLSGPYTVCSLTIGIPALVMSKDIYIYVNPCSIINISHQLLSY